MIDRARRVPLTTKIAYAIGSLEGAVVGIASMATLLFYNQIHGVSASLCGTAFLVASIIDGISDPLVGAYSDQFRSRWGRRHPLMFVTALPFALAFYLLYQPPGGLSETGLFIWLLGFLVLMRVASTFFSVPHAALAAEMTEDYHERTSLFGFNSVTGMIGGAAIGIFVLVVIFPTSAEFSNGLLDESRYPYLATFGAVMLIVVLFGCTLGTRDQIPYLHDQPARTVNVQAYFRELRHLLSNRSYISVCASWLVLATSIGIIGTVSTYSYVYVYEISTEQLTIQQFVSLPGILIAIPLAKYLTRKLDKKMTVISCCLVCGVLLASPHCLRLIGFFPDNDSVWLLPALFGPVFLAYLVAPVFAIVVDSQLADVTDDHEHRTGHRSEGVVFSIRTFGIKATSGLGGLIGGFGLDFFQFPKNAVVGEVAPQAVNGLLIMTGPFYLFTVFVGVLFMTLYQLTESRHADILEELKVARQ